MMTGSLLKNVMSWKYSEWLNYTQKVCAQKKNSEEAKDILHEVLCDLWENNLETLEKLLCTSLDDLDHYVVKVIRNNIQSQSAPYYRRYHRIDGKIDRNVDASKLNILEEEETLDDLELILRIFNQLDISERKRQIFKFSYQENHLLKEWQGTESISYQSKICKEIRQMIIDILKRLRRM